MAAQLQLDQHTQGRTVTLRPAGELDLATSPQFEAAVRKICEEPEREVLLDLSEVTSVDTEGVRALVRAQRVFEETDCGFWVMGASAPVRRVLEQCGALGALPLSD
jgi:anti-anti-sigma factor